MSHGSTWIAIRAGLEFPPPPVRIPFLVNDSPSRLEILTVIKCYLDNTNVVANQSIDDDFDLKKQTKQNKLF